MRCVYILITPDRRDIEEQWVFLRRGLLARRPRLYQKSQPREISLVLTGNTWNFRDDLEKAGVSGARNENGGYYLFLKNIDVADADSKHMIWGNIDILHKQAARVVVDPEPEEGTLVADFLAELKEMPCLYFD